jgi:hypothetical protein
MFFYTRRARNYSHTDQPDFTAPGESSSKIAIYMNFIAFFEYALKGNIRSSAQHRWHIRCTNGGQLFLGKGRGSRKYQGVKEHRDENDEKTSVHKD